MREFMHDAVKVADTPTLICEIGQDIEQCLLRNVGAGTVYVGGRHVVAQVAIGHQDMALGFPLNPGERLELKTYEFDSIQVWAVAPRGKSGLLVFLASG